MSIKKTEHFIRSLENDVSEMRAAVLYLLKEKLAHDGDGGNTEEDQELIEETKDC